MDSAASWPPGYVVAHTGVRPERWIRPDEAKQPLAEGRWVPSQIVVQYDLELLRREDIEVAAYLCRVMTEICVAPHEAPVVPNPLRLSRQCRREIGFRLFAFTHCMHVAAESAVGGITKNYAELDLGQPRPDSLCGARPVQVHR